MMVFGVPIDQLAAQLMLGLINGSFYAVLSMGLAIIFGLLNIINFAHGALYMVGAFAAWMGLAWFGVNYWTALVVAPLVVGAFGVVIERVLLQWLYKMDHLYGLLLTLGMTLVIEGVFRDRFGSSGRAYAMPAQFAGGVDMGFLFLPYYRLWVIAACAVICASTWYAIERTRLGAYLRAAIQRPDLVLAFGVNVPRMITLTYAFGVALAALAGVLAAPIYSVSPLMGSNLVIIVFAVVIVGGMGSIRGAVLAGFALGIVEGLTKAFYPEAANAVIFIVMAIFLLLKPDSPYSDSKA